MSKTWNKYKVEWHYALKTVFTPFRKRTEAYDDLLN